MLLQKAKNTAFGQDHGFAQIDNYEDFAKQVPVRDYEGIRSYVDRVVAGEADILWPGKPRYFSKTSGTTSGVKYIPISKESMPTHIKTAQNALFHYIHHSGNTSFVDGKMIFYRAVQYYPKPTGLIQAVCRGLWRIIFLRICKKTACLLGKQTA